jgi:DNA-directed RNA polymerase sigma subunit (sigma70/sigma32)
LTYAHWLTRQAVEATIANQAKTIRLPIDVIKDGRLGIGG